MPLIRRPPAIALLLACLLAQAPGPAAGAAPAPQTPAPEAEGPAPKAPAPAEPERTDGLPRFETSISYTANLVHWIDNLAGSSRGKTVRSYRQYWSRRFGTPSEAEMDLLRSWVEVRWKPFPRPAPAVLNPSGCLPQIEDVPDWRQRFRLRSYEAATPEAFAESLAGDLRPDEIAALKRVIDAFRPRFDAAWRETTYLPRFEERLRRFLEEGGLRPYLGEVAAFFGVDAAAAPPGRIHLMALPEEGPTHAQADGRHLLIEVRPNDTPVEQIQVVAHETSHYLWSLLDPARNDALARQVFAAGASGAATWSLLREALPTALGQGLAEARLAPQRFSLQHRWYHLDEVDQLAKEIYPAVEAAIRARRRAGDGAFAEIARRAEGSAVTVRAAPAGYLLEAYFAFGEGMRAPYEEIRSRIPARADWSFPASDPNGPEFLERYECLSGVVLLGPEEAEDGARASVRAVRRPGGGTLFYLLAPRPGDAARIGGFFLDLRRRPDEAVYLDGEGGR